MPVPKTSSPVIADRVFLQDRVYDTLHTAIVSGEIAPGASLSDAQLLEKFDASRAPVRAALRRLANDGLVVVQPQVGTWVRTVTREHTMETMAVYRGMVEVAVRIAAASLSDSDIARLRDRGRAILTSEPGLDAMQRVDEFYGVFFERAGNQTMRRIYTQVGMHLRQVASAGKESGIKPRSVDDVITAASTRATEPLLSASHAHLDQILEDLVSPLPQDGPSPQARRHLTRPFLRNETYSAIRDAIADGVLEQGEHLKADELAEWLGVSKAPIKDALARLSDEGLVETVPNQYTRVAYVDAEELAQYASAQLALYTTAVEEGAGRLEPEQRVKLNEIANRVFAAIADDSSSTVLRELFFHAELLADAAHNHVLVHFMNQLGPRVSQSLSLPGREAAMERLAVVFDQMHSAVMEGQPLKAADLLRGYAGISGEEPSGVVDLGGAT